MRRPLLPAALLSMAVLLAACGSTATTTLAIDGGEVQTATVTVTLDGAVAAALDDDARGDLEAALATVGRTDVAADVTDEQAAFQVDADPADLPGDLLGVAAVDVESRLWSEQVVVTVQSPDGLADALEGLPDAALRTAQQHITLQVELDSARGHTPVAAAPGWETTGDGWQATAADAGDGQLEARAGGPSATIWGVAALALLAAAALVSAQRRRSSPARRGGG